jgi:hypothetical protein
MQHNIHPFAVDLIDDTTNEQAAAADAVTAAKTALNTLKAQRATLDADHSTPPTERAAAAVTLDQAIKFATGDLDAADRRQRHAAGSIRRAEQAALASPEGGRRRRHALTNTRRAILAKIDATAGKLADLLLELDTLDRHIERSIDAEARQHGAHIGSDAGTGTAAARLAAEVRDIPAAVAVYPAPIASAIARSVIGNEPYAQFNHWTFSPHDLDAPNTERLRSLIPGGHFQRWTHTSSPSSPTPPGKAKTPRPTPGTKDAA